MNNRNKKNKHYTNIFNYALGEIRTRDLQIMRLTP